MGAGDRESVISNTVDVLWQDVQVQQELKIHKSMQYHGRKASW